MTEEDTMTEEDLMEDVAAAEAIKHSSAHLGRSSNVSQHLHKLVFALLFFPLTLLPTKRMVVVVVLGEGSRMQLVLV